MFSVIFPGQGSQLVGMGKDLYDKYSLVQNLFNEADVISLHVPLSKETKHLISDVEISQMKNGVIMGGPIIIKTRYIIFCG